PLELRLEARADLLFQFAAEVLERFTAGSLEGGRGPGFHVLPSLAGPLVHLLGTNFQAGIEFAADFLCGRGAQRVDLADGGLHALVGLAHGGKKRFNAPALAIEGGAEAVQTRVEFRGPRLQGTPGSFQSRM